MALGIARRTGATVKLLHVLQPFVEVVPELAAYQPLAETDFREEKQKYLDDVVRRVKEASDVSVKTEVLLGEVAATIREAAEGKVDLVVMTTHGRGPLARFWLGSVTDQLVREMHVPILLVHPSKDAPDFRTEPAVKHMLLPLDGTAHAEAIMPAAVETAKVMGAAVKLFRVIRTELPPDLATHHRGNFLAAQAREMLKELEAAQAKQKREAEAYLAGVAARMKARGVMATVKVVLDETPASAILHEAEGMDMVALETHGRGGLKRLWLGSVADKIVRGSAVPVLVQRPM
jgi:nucleotide-binding universal stress UspA family protein